ncbi:hypothetical protein CCM_07805 [Cordyceps militaris CM01]|uniref:Uncharacterized protein n=2 Tax=Cordyceps militaris TaxID=73501 RepID=G3JQP9_CORMM|nr:uncharacterized protein CCM_07805 [Cordyceps militaris CM01]ATY63131.1 hypothetical protein A9K55_007211 [Cordyceps militaris]EGX89553.1 hypothetical protein CCM_07805 [Cordyceps militaris CM01]
MGAALSGIKVLIVPATISLALFLLVTFAVLPLWRRYRNRYSQYLPLGSLGSAESLRDRIAGRLAALTLPSTWRRDRGRFAAGTADEGEADTGEELGRVGTGATAGRTTTGFVLSILNLPVLIDHVFVSTYNGSEAWSVSSVWTVIDLDSSSTLSCLSSSTSVPRLVDPPQKLSVSSAKLSTNPDLFSQDTFAFRCGLWRTGGGSMSFSPSPSPPSGTDDTGLHRKGSSCERPYIKMLVRPSSLCVALLGASVLAVDCVVLDAADWRAASRGRDGGAPG